MYGTRRFLLVAIGVWCLLWPAAAFPQGSEKQFRSLVQQGQAELKRAEQAGFVPGIFGICNQLGVIYRQWGKHDEALEYLNRALDLAVRGGEPLGEAQCRVNIGLTYADMGRYHDAVRDLEKAGDIFERFNQPSGSAMVFHNLGQVCGVWGKLDKAAGYYEKSLSLRRSMKDTRWEGLTLIALGYVHYQSGKSDKAVECFQDSAEVLEKLSRTPGIGPREAKDITKGRANALQGMGQALYDKGDLTKAADAFQKAASLARSINEGKTEAECLNSTGLVCALTGRYKEAWDCFRRALELFESYNDERGMGAVRRNMGILYCNSGQYDKALDCFKSDLEVCRKFNDKRGQSSALMNLGNIHADMGNYPEAVEQFKQAAELCRQLQNERGEAAALNNLALMHEERGEYRKALEVYKQSCDKFHRVVDQNEEAKVLLNMGRVYCSIEEYGDARKNLEQGLAMMKKSGASTSWGESLVIDSLLDQGKLKEARDRFASVKDKPWMLAGRLALAESAFGKAKDAYSEGLRFGEKSRNTRALFAAHTGLGLAAEGLDDYPAAAEHFRNAVNLTEQLRESLERPERRVFLNVKIGGFLRTVPYEGLARVLLKMNQPEESFTASEHGKARSFAESFSKGSEGKRLDVPAEMLKKDEELTRQLRETKKMRQDAFEAQQAETLKSLDARIKELEKERADHIKKLQEKAPLFAATSYPKPMDLKNTALRDDEWTLAYDVTDPGVLIYLLHGKTLVKALFKPVPRTKLTEIVKEFRNPLEMKEKLDPQKLEDFDFVLGKKLTDLLLADMLPTLPKEAAVMVAPDDSLGTMPFEALVLNEGGTVVTEGPEIVTKGVEFFGDRTSVSYCQSVTALTLARRFAKGKKPGERSLVMDDPIFDLKDPRFKKFASDKRLDILKVAPDKLCAAIEYEAKDEGKMEIIFPRLEETRELGDALKKLEPAKTEEYHDMAACKSLLFEKPLDGYNSMVFATHGYFGKGIRGILEPVLVFTLVNQPEGKDGFLRLSEVMGLKLNADIVALTACQTGLGKHISGEGTMGMGRAFQYAGAKSVLMSLWSVHPKASVDLVGSFFKHMKEGKNKLEALRLAREEIRKDGYDHPFYWAPFILVGEVN